MLKPGLESSVIPPIENGLNIVDRKLMTNYLAYPFSYQDKLEDGNMLNLFFIY